MEPVTHLLTGACLSRAGFNRYSAWATATMVVAAEAPDIDFVTYFWNPVRGFEFHRNYTHTFVGVPVIAGLVVLLMYGIFRWRRRRKPDMEVPRWGALYGLALLACASHILLDFTNAYGVVPFMPFSYHWISWDIVSIAEPLLWLFLFGGLLLPGLFALVTEDIGYRRQRYRGRGGAMVALVLMVALWGVRDYQHRRALAAMNSVTYEGQNALSVAAYPYAGNPFRWYGVAETPAFYETMDIDSLRGEIDPKARVVYKPPDTPVTLAAKNSLAGRVYLWWAKYPMTETQVEQGPSGLVEGYTVRLWDMRYAYPSTRQRRTPLGCWVELDKDLRVLDMGVGPFRGRERLP